MSDQLSSTPADLRRDVCKALTRVVRKSKLSAAIDPKAFFMMLNANYAVLYRDNLFDLTPVWQALAAQHSTADLAGLFIRFSEALHERGLRVVMPPQVANLTPEEQKLHLEAFENQPADSNEAEVVALTDELDALTGDAGPAPMLELNTGDLRPYIGPETRRDIIQAVVQSVKAAPIGERVDGSQLAYLVDNNFDALCDGASFDLEPVFQGLRDLGNVADRDLYLASTVLREALHPHQIEVRHQTLDVSEAEARQLIQQYARAKQQAKRDAVLAVTHTIDTPSPPPTETVDQQPRAEARRTELRRLGLGQGDRRTLQRIRAAVLITVFLIVATPAYLFRSTRPLSVNPYEGTIPLKSARLRNGLFVGELDDEKWWPLPLEQREDRLRKFQVVVRAQGFAPDLQVRDAKDRLVITTVGPGHLRGSPFFMRGRADGSLIVPPDYSDAQDTSPKITPQKEPDSEDQPEPEP